MPDPLQNPIIPTPGILRGCDPPDQTSGWSIVPRLILWAIIIYCASTVVTFVSDVAVLVAKWVQDGKNFRWNEFFPSPFVWLQFIAFYFKGIIGCVGLISALLCAKYRSGASRLLGLSLWLMLLSTIVGEVFFSLTLFFLPLPFRDTDLKVLQLTYGLRALSSAAVPAFLLAILRRKSITLHFSQQ